MRLLRKPTWMKGAALLACTTFVAATAFAQGPPAQPTIYNSMAITLLVIIVALALAIGLLANVVIGAAQINMDRFKAARKQAANAAKVVTMITFCLLSGAVFAQESTTATAAAPASSPVNYGGLSATTFYLLISVIALELLVLVFLVYQLKSLLAKERPMLVAGAAPVAAASAWSTWWEKINSFRPVHEEEKIDMGHDYDGIRELDNSLPKWWLYGFYLCIVFAGIYMYRYHVSHSAPSSEQEYLASVAKADAAKEEYLKKSASKVDENTVVMLTDAAQLADGKKLFASNCAACHGPDGGGIVGPNLTDDYWINKGSVKDIFKTIKYGVAEKGMKSWKDDFSPVQIDQLASIYKSVAVPKPAS